MQSFKQGCGGGIIAGTVQSAGAVRLFGAPEAFAVGANCVGKRPAVPAGPGLWPKVLPWNGQQISGALLLRTYADSCCQPVCDSACMRLWHALLLHSQVMMCNICVLQSVACSQQCISWS
jgi:hypothetical protein